MDAVLVTQLELVLCSHQEKSGSAENRKLRLWFTQAHQSLTTADWRNISRSDEFWFVLWWSHGSILPRIRASIKHHSVLLLTASICKHPLIALHVTKLKSPPTGFLTMTMSSLYSGRLHSLHISNKCVGTRDSHHVCTADESAAAVWCSHIYMNQNLRGMFAAPCWISAVKH